MTARVCTHASGWYTAWSGAKLNHSQSGSGDRHQTQGILGVWVSGGASLRPPLVRSAVVLGPASNAGQSKAWSCRDAPVWADVILDILPSHPIPSPLPHKPQTSPQHVRHPANHIPCV